MMSRSETTFPRPIPAAIVNANGEARQVSQGATPATLAGTPHPDGPIRSSHGKPRLLDLFCGAGGCTKGYQRAGFYVVGVDINPQPNYCGDEFVRMDALKFLRWLAWGRERHPYAAVHASPPCQHYLNLGGVNRAQGREYDHPDLIAPTRELLEATGLPYVIENVPDARAALRDPVMLCGTSFGLPLRRHRLFESTVSIMAQPCAHHLFTEPRYWTGWRPKGEKRLSTVVQVYGNAADRHEWPAAMGIDWMTNDEMAEAVPPAYTEHIGGYILAAIQEGAKAA